MFQSVIAQTYQANSNISWFIKIPSPVDIQLSLFYFGGHAYIKFPGRNESEYWHSLPTRFQTLNSRHKPGPIWVQPIIAREEILVLIQTPNMYIEVFASFSRNPIPHWHLFPTWKIVADRGIWSVGFISSNANFTELVSATLLHKVKQVNSDKAARRKIHKNQNWNVLISASYKQEKVETGLFTWASIFGIVQKCVPGIIID